MFKSKLIALPVLVALLSSTNILAMQEDRIEYQISRSTGTEDGLHSSVIARGYIDAAHPRFSIADSSPKLGKHWVQVNVGIVFTGVNRKPVLDIKICNDEAVAAMRESERRATMIGAVTVGTAAQLYNISTVEPAGRKCKICCCIGKKID